MKLAALETKITSLVWIWLFVLVESRDLFRSKEVRIYKDNWTQVNFIFSLKELDERTEREEYAFPASNKVTKTDEEYFNIIKGEWEPSSSEVMKARPSGLQTDISSDHPSLVFSYHSVLWSEGEPELGLGLARRRFVVGLQIINIAEE